MHNEIPAIESLFEKTFGTKPETTSAMPPSGSYRKYYRLSLGEKSYIAAYNEDWKENRAFISFTKSFLQKGLLVPAIIADDLPNNVYLLQDLGDCTLLSYITIDNDGHLSDQSIAMYKKALEQLPQLQVEGGKIVDYGHAYPRHAFDEQSMLWDLNYFKYYFLKLARVPFDEQGLEDDFQSFCSFLLQADCTHFMFRDFQSRNIMVHNNQTYFIDYQGGRKGALQYDIASILFEAKTSLSPQTREILFQHYLKALSVYYKLHEPDFTKYYYGYVYIRIMQAMGAYGFRGLYEKKELFLQSIPKALDHLKWLRENVQLPISLPHLEKVWDNLIHSGEIRALANKAIGLNVRINSFSYKRSIPADETSNGGGFVFDCRALPNPGRLEKYQHLTGRDAEVANYLKDLPEVTRFLNATQTLVDQSIDTYLQRGFKNLMVNFGCTGGQHRSVYSAEQLAAHIKNNYPHVNVIVKHREQELKL